MRVLNIWQVDVFTTRPLAGNPCAVILGAEGLPPETLQAVAREMNLSETVFLLPATDPNASYRVRIFTPRSEIPFAGHPTIAAALVARDSGFASVLPGQQELVQECGIGLVPVRGDDDQGHWRWTMTQRLRSFRVVEHAPAQVAHALGCPPEALAQTPASVVSTGIPWMIVELTDLETLASLQPRATELTALYQSQGAVGLAAFTLGAGTPQCQLRLRAFPPSEGIDEDPVTGSANGCLGAHLQQTGRFGGARFAYRAEQGVEIGRPGIIDVAADYEAEDPVIRVGGAAVTLMWGQLHLPDD